MRLVRKIEPWAAIVLLTAFLALGLPAVEPELCIGCGLCEHACPPGGGIVVERGELA